MQVTTYFNEHLDDLGNRDNPSFGLRLYGIITILFAAYCF